MRCTTSRTRFLLGALLVLWACQSPTSSGAVGSWGGSQASLELSHAGGTITYQCGNGTIAPGWTLAADGSFSATGEHYFGGGPVPSGGRPPHAATYSGKVNGGHMSLTVTVPDAGVTIGPLDLVRGGPTVTQMCV